MRVGFLGNAGWSVPSLEALARSPHGPSLVATRIPRPGRRGGGPVATPVAEAARRLALPLAEVETVKSGPGFEALRSASLDVLAVVAYGEILPPAVLALPSVAPVNLHFSLLPRLRGAAPVQRAILEGLERTGVTTIRMDEGLDTGPILLQREELIRANEDAGTLGGRLAEVGADLLVETLDALAAGAVQERSQDDEEATYAPKLRAQDQVIDWTRPATDVVRLVRALAPDPSAVTAFRGRRLKVLRAQRHPSAEGRGPLGGAASPGSILVGSREFLVRAGEDEVLLQEVALEGRPRMSGAELLRGYRPEPGEVLGS